MTQIPLNQNPVGGATDCGPEHTRADLPEHEVSTMSGHRQRQHRAEHEGLTPSTRIGIKITNSSRNRTGAAVLEGRDLNRPLHDDIAYNIL